MVVELDTIAQVIGMRDYTYRHEDLEWQQQYCILNIDGFGECRIMPECSRWLRVVDSDSEAIQAVTAYRAKLGAFQEQTGRLMGQLREKHGPCPVDLFLDDAEWFLACEMGSQNASND